LPNWCLNNATITHDDPAKLTELVDAYKRGELMEHYLPSPKDDMGVLDEDWYDWRLKNWGTKWDVGGENALVARYELNEVVLSFDSAWSPPIEFYSFLKDEHGFDIRASYFEPGIGFCGDWIDGMDHYWDGGIEDFPKHLIDEYNMREFYQDEEVA
jgi:hypothetical protein